jgi:hypothetical protein
VRVIRVWLRRSVARQQEAAPDLKPRVSCSPYLSDLKENKVVACRRDWLNRTSATIGPRPFPAFP